MTVKELYKKYKGYTIMLFGLPLDKSSTPFSCLPLDVKVLDTYIIKDLRIDETPVEALCFTIDLKYKGIEKSKGTVKAYIVKPN